MWKAVRSILAVIAGFVAASAVMMVIEAVNGPVLYPELGKMAEGMTDRQGCVEKHELHADGRHELYRSLLLT